MMKKLILSVLFIFIGCSEPEPTNIKLLKNIEGVYYDSNGKPFSGEVFKNYSDNSGDVWISGTLDKGFPETYIEPVSSEKLNFRNDGIFLINTSIPFTGPYYITNDEKLIEEGNYSSGQLNGKIVGYFSSGQVQYEGFVTNGKINFTNNFFENGQFESKIEYSNNKPISESSFYENGQLKEKKFYNDEKLNGEYVSYFENGQLKEKQFFNNDKLDGDYVSYFNNGQIKKEIIYDNNIIKNHTYYFNNGNIEREGSSDCDYRIYGYEIDGTLKTDLTYKNCKKSDGFITTIYGTNQFNNIYKRFYENGIEIKEEYELYDKDFVTTTTKGTKIFGEKEGLWVSYFSDGSIEEQKNYKKGKLDGTLKRFHYNGQLKSVSNWKNDTLDGTFEEFSFNGDLVSEVNYLNGKKNGPFKIVRLGDEYEVGTYVNGSLEGINKIFSKDGRLLFESNYKNNNLHGEQIRYNSDGKIVTRTTWENGKIVKQKY